MHLPRSTRKCPDFCATTPPEHHTDIKQRCSIEAAGGAHQRTGERMQRHLSKVVWSIVKACGLLAGLAACAPPPAHFASRLDSVPTPTPVLMAKTSAPDCRIGAARASASTAKKPKAAAAADGPASDFENEAEASNSTVASAKSKTSSEAPDNEVERLTRERDCYRRAEQVARQRLDALQATSTQTMLALDQLRSDVPRADIPPGW